MLDWQFRPICMTEMKSALADKQKINRVEVYWHTVKYRTVALYAVVIIAILLAGTYLVFPAASAFVLKKLSDVMNPSNGAAAITLASRQARFVNLDGKVQIKKANSVQWVNADYQITLDRGDLVQTGPEGVARIAFADGTQYTVKSDTLVTVEENNVGQESTQVAVHITSGQVDLNTGGLSSGSKAEVSFENAVADLHSNSHAAVSSNPETQQQQITVTEGSADFTRGNDHVDIGQSERLSYTTGGPITKSEVLSPPELAEPINLAPIIVADPKHDPIHFSWKPVATAVSYEFQASTTMMFNKLVMDKKSQTDSVDVSGFDPGDYFWRVRAIDAKNNLSDPSDPFKFTLVAQGKEQDMLLEVDETQLAGNVVEVIGRTEPGAALIINGEQVAAIQPDGHFRYFTQPMSRGSHEIVITGQNRRGGTAIKRVQVVIP